MDEKVVLLLACKGDPLAFEKLVELYYRRVYSIAFVRLKNREDARDVTQEVFMLLYRNLKKFDPGKNFFTWLYAVVLNAVRSFWRRNPKKLETDDLILDELVFSDDGKLNRDDRIQLFLALDCLAEDDRQVLLMHYFDDLAVKEIAEVLKLSESNAKIKLFRARKKLESFFNGENHE